MDAINSVFGRVTSIGITIISLTACGGGSDSGNGSGVSTPNISFSSSVQNIKSGQGVNLIWSTSGVSSCSASGSWSGVKSVSGNEIIAPTSLGQHDYIIDCNGSSGSVSQKISINVTGGYVVGGSINGLSGSGLLVSLGSENLSVTSNGNFQFKTVLLSGSTYSASVKNQPVGQFCEITNSSGTISLSDISNFSISCISNHSISGIINGLTGSGLTLINNGDESINIPIGSTSFTFTKRTTKGNPYSVSIFHQPAHQNCVINNGSGTALNDVSSITVTCRERHVYVTNAANSISIFMMGTDGSLTPYGIPQAQTGKVPSGLITDPSGKYLYVINAADNNIWLYNISQVSGYPAHVTNANVGTGFGPASIAMTPSGQYVYVANNGDGTVSEYTVTTNGFLTPIGVIAAGTNPISIAVDPTGKYAYVANAGTNNVSQYLIGNNGVLSKMTPSTIAVNSLHPNSIAIDPSGKYAYVVSGNVAQFTIGSSGALTPMSVAEVDAGITPSDIDIDPSGKYAYVPYALGVATYDISSNGQLTRTNTQSLRFYPSKMVIDPDGSVYSANEKINSVSKFDVVGDGVIVPALGGYSIGSTPISITTDAVR